MQVSIEPFDMKLFPKLRELFACYFPADDRLLTERYTQWLYADNPHGPAQAVIAQEDGRWIGFMAMIPVQLIRRGASLKGYYVVNVLVHPEHQGRFIFGKLIAQAKELIRLEGAVLMGHPNDLALKAWQRAKMQFHTPLQPFMLKAGSWFSKLGAQDVKAAQQAEPFLSHWHLPENQSNTWNVHLTVDYLNWRYLTHPTNTYRIRLVGDPGGHKGLFITKKIKGPVHLLVDLFALEASRRDVTKNLPMLTLSMRPQTTGAAGQDAWWALPLKKRIPFFSTSLQQQQFAQDWSGLLLSASDF
jgi:GNAT superfamily N-acetyltransferase